MIYYAMMLYNVKTLPRGAQTPRRERSRRKSGEQPAPAGGERPEEARGAAESQAPHAYHQRTGEVLLRGVSTLRFVFHQMHLCSGSLMV